MNEKPILFSAPMVRAIIEGRKTMTRRVVKPQHCFAPSMRQGESAWNNCPYGQPGDTLWVRETWAIGDRDNDVLYAADPSWNVNGVAVPPPVNKGTVHAGNWRPSIYMPRWASRITLEVTAVRVERLQEITEDDARAEGVALGIDGQTGRLESGGAAFLKLWDSINAERGYGWTVNPWVWVVSFKLQEASNDR